MRNTTYSVGEFYHIYNRGVDKRVIYNNKNDLDRFFKCMDEFNSVEPIGSIYENSFNKPPLGSSTSKLGKKRGKKLVNFVCYCLNSNHYHFLLEQVAENGIEKFMHRLGTGYTKYFNIKNKRSGSLFQGRYKSAHIDNNEYLLHLSSYINQNNKIHKNNNLYKSSLDEYTSINNTFCKKDIILDQFKNISEYNEFLKSSFEFILENKEKQKEIRDLLLE